MACTKPTGLRPCQSSETKWLEEDKSRRMMSQTDVYVYNCRVSLDFPNMLRLLFTKPDSLKLGQLRYNKIQLQRCQWVSDVISDLWYDARLGYHQRWITWDEREARDFFEGFRLQWRDKGGRWTITMSAHTQELSFTPGRTGPCIVLRAGENLWPLSLSLFICSDDKQRSNSKDETPRRVPTLLETASTCFAY